VQGGMTELLASPLVKNRSLESINSSVSVYEGDIRRVCADIDSPVDIVVTSPPYPNVTDYARSQRLSMWLMDCPMERIREEEIGARFKRHRRQALADYWIE